mgnify:CR=1 FL=1
MSGETDLTTLLQTLQPELSAEAFVFVSVPYAVSPTQLANALMVYKEDEGTTFPSHLLGLNGLIGVIAIFFESKDKIGPCTDKLYAVLPAGVETKTPSEINFFIKIFLLFSILKLLVCLLCLSKETSLIAMAEKFLFFLVTTFISSGEIDTSFDLEMFFKISSFLYLFIKKPKVPLLIP